MNRLAIAAAAALLAVLTACGNEPTPTTPASAPVLPPDVASTSQPAPATKPATNSQGRIVKKFGEDAGMADEGGNQWLTFAVTKVTVDPKCTYGSSVAGTHTLLLDVKVATGQLTDKNASDLAVTMNPFAFQEISKSGETSAAQASSCTSGKRLPDTWASNSKYTGQIALDVPEASGTIALVPGVLNEVGGGWEWKY